ncbi:MAG: 4Fe-4S binding protein [Magnetococcales bacterium]|nr:4Fe-4S binding protein [Magnetococcales bacterium]
MPSLRTIRRIYSVFFMGLFLWLIYVADVGHVQGYRVQLFLEADPLTAIAAFFTSGTLYKGMAWALVILIPTLFFGRFFCSWMCPLGILNQWLGHLFHGRRPAESLKANSYRPIFRLKYWLLVVLLVLSLAGALQIGLLDPIALVTRSFDLALWPALQQWGVPLYPHPPVFQGGVGVALLFIAILLANRWFPRFWCRLVCPLGALLGVLASRAPFRIRRNVDKCTDCQKCLHACQGACDPHAALRVSECHLCMNCIENCPEGALDYGIPQQRTTIRQPLDVNRRRLLEGTVAAAALFPMARSALSSQSTPQPAVIRPPGSLPEREFLARCIKCAACMRICPTNVLQPALLEAGIEGIWTPVLIPRLGYCEHYCVLCGQVCPTGAIRAIPVAEKVGHPPHKEPVRLGTAFFDQGRCLPWAMQTPCIVCEEVCPTSPKAIWYRKVEVTDRQGKTVTLKQPYVDPALCIGCGICENKCPVTDYAAIRVTSVGESRSRRNRMIL